MSNTNDTKEEDIKRKLAKLKSDLENITSQVQANYFLGDIKNLASKAAAFGVTLDLSGLEKSIEAKIQNFKEKEDINLLKEQEEQNLLKEQEEQNLKVKIAQELRQKEEQVQEESLKINNLYKDFEQNTNKNIYQYKEKKKDLEEITNELENKNIIKSSLLSKLRRQYAEMLEIEAECGENYITYEKATIDHIEIKDELEDINNKIKEVENQLKRKDLKPEKIEKLKNKLEFNQELLKIRTPLVEEINHAQEQADKSLAEQETQKQAYHEQIKKIGKVIAARYEEDPAKYQDIKDTHQVFDVIMNNGIIDDVAHHNKVLSEIRNSKIEQEASKIREQIQGKEQVVNYNFCPSRTLTDKNLSKSKTR